jgi:hypothetical protein
MVKKNRITHNEGVFVKLAEHKVSKTGMMVPLDDFAFRI